MLEKPFIWIICWIYFKNSIVSFKGIGLWLDGQIKESFGKCRLIPKDSFFVVFKEEQMKNFITVH